MFDSSIMPKPFTCGTGVSTLLRKGMVSSESWDILYTCCKNGHSGVAVELRKGSTWSC